MYKLLLTSVLLISSTLINANDRPQSRFSDNSFNKNIWNDFNKQFEQFEQRMNQMQSQNNFGTQSRRYFDKENNNYVIQISVDGLNKENMEIITKDNIISIKGKIKIQRRLGNNLSTSSKSFSQSFSLPNDADDSNINANFKDKILTVSIPKLEEPKPTVRKIEIK